MAKPIEARETEDKSAIAKYAHEKISVIRLFLRDREEYKNAAAERTFSIPVDGADRAPLFFKLFGVPYELDTTGKYKQEIRRYSLSLQLTRVTSNTSLSLHTEFELPEDSGEIKYIDGSVMFVDQGVTAPVRKNLLSFFPELEPVSSLRTLVVMPDALAIAAAAAEKRE